MSYNNFPTNVPHYVYALMCEDEHGHGYLKIGHTVNMKARYSQLVSGCPFPIKKIALVDCGMNWVSKNVEKALHQQLKIKKTKGEWFEVDFRDKEDKARFNEASKLAFKAHMPSRKNIWWRLVDPKELKGAYLKAPGSSLQMWA